MISEHPWNQVPLEDYERHMQHDSVAQLQFLNTLTGKYLQIIKPEKALFLGIAGGNGLDQIDSTVTKKIVGLDINAKYLDETRKRYQIRLPQLELIQIDIDSSANLSIVKADWVWAALVLEYVDLANCFSFIQNNITSNGNLIITLQQNNGLQSVSKTGVQSIQCLGQVFREIPEDELLKHAVEKGFELLETEVNDLPNGKSFKTFLFIKKQ